jgi:hypothetical protein
VVLVVKGLIKKTGYWNKATYGIIKKQILKVSGVLLGRVNTGDL